MSYDRWTEWYRFSDIFEYRGLVTEASNSRKRREHLGNEGFLANDDGFRLRSIIYRRPTFQEPLIESLEEVPCPLNKGDVGVYWIKIKHKEFVFDYIGKCAEDKDGMRKRLTQHFRKICNVAGHPYQANMKGELRFTTDDERGFSVPQNFKAASEKIKECGLDPSDPNQRFWDHFCWIKFVKVNKTKKNFKEKIHRIEGMALQRYKAEYEKFPDLNSTDETIGMGNFLP